MKLPYGKAAELEQIIHKLETYALNTNHDKGKHKARVFRAKLGITIDNKNVLANALLDAAATGEARPTRADKYGEQYVINFLLTTDIGFSMVCSAWIIRVDER
ncbi:MAG: DUF6883 domain-containing protein, partial [Cyanobacteria bacterium J06588_5]